MQNKKFIEVVSMAESTITSKPKRLAIAVDEIIGYEELMVQSSQDPDRVNWIRGTCISVRHAEDIVVRHPYELVHALIRHISSDGDSYLYLMNFEKDLLAGYFEQMEYLITEHYPKDGMICNTNYRGPLWVGDHEQA